MGRARRGVLEFSSGESAEDRNHLCRIFSGTQWDVSSVAGCLQAIAHLTWQRVPVVVCEARLSDGSWRDILAYAAQRALRGADRRRAARGSPPRWKWRATEGRVFFVSHFTGARCGVPSHVRVASQLARDRRGRWGAAPHLVVMQMASQAFRAN